MNSETNRASHDFSSWFDVLAVFSLAVLPDLVRSFILTNSTGAASWSFDTLLTMLVVRSFQVSLPILLILKLRRVQWADYGFTKFRFVYDPLVALGLALLGYIAYYTFAFGLIFAGLGFSGDANALQSTIGDAAQPRMFTIVLLILASCTNGFAEEIAIRAYLLVRIGELCGSIVVAVVLTTIFFAAYHSYQGRYGIVSAFAIGAVFAIYFVTTKRFWPIAIAHALMDVVGFALLLGTNAG